jgi:hypothetical protein
MTKALSQQIQIRHKMKRFASLFLASILVGFAVFAIWRWLIRSDFTESFGAAISAAGAGLIVEYLRPYLIWRNKDNIGER